MLQKLQWDSLQQRRACSRVLMLYRIRNGLVAIPASIYLQPTVVHTRRFKTSYRQIQCNKHVQSSFLVQSDYGTPCQLMSASCYLTVLRLNWTSSSWCNCRPAMFLIAPLHCFTWCCFGFLLGTTNVLTTSTAHTCTYTAVQYCSITELAPLLDEDDDEVLVMLYRPH